VDQILGHILRNAVWERLDLLDELAMHADARSLASVAHTELPRLTGSWRTLLAQHEPNDKGNCPSCSSRWRPQKAPCTVWQAAHQHLVAPEAKTAKGADRHPAAAPVHGGHQVEARSEYHGGEHHSGQHVAHRPGQPTGHHQRPAPQRGGAIRPATLR
jgi:hypothetical protein